MRPRWVVVSVVAHVAVAGAIVMSYGPWRVQVPERMQTYLVEMPFLREVAIAPPPPPAPAERGARRPFELPMTPELPAPGTMTPPVEDTSAIEPPGAEGGVPGGRGLAAAVPTFGDARVWAIRPLFVPEGGGRPIEMDSMVRLRLIAMADMMDSIARTDTLSLAADRRMRTPSWIVERNGRRYGLDASGIHFGSFTLPAALLAFLPLPQGNIDQARANQRMMEMRAEILRAAARAEAEDDFNRAVQGVRERWRREREERRAREDEQRRQAGTDRPNP